MQKRWHVLDSAPQSFFDAHPEFPPVILNLLFHRGLQTQAEIDTFLNPEYSKDVYDPALFCDMEKAVTRIFLAIEKNERTIIHGDYDADGVSGSVILSSLFTALGYTNFDVFLPHREIDGYGLNMHTVEMLADQKANLIITCDCGISNSKETAFANEKGVDVIITDHHAIPETLPPAYAIIHPKVPGETYPDKNLAGGAVAFKLMQAMLKKHAETHSALPNGDRHEAFEKWQLDMVALSCVADMVPLIGEPRTLTKYGLIVMNKTRRIGLQKLLLEARLMHEDGTMRSGITAETIGFQIAPRINAAGRVNHANVGYKLLVTNDPIEATDRAYELNQNNQERQKLTEKAVKQAMEQVERGQKNQPFLFVFDTDWTPGIVGLIASRVKEAHQKPVFAMTHNKGEIMGSGRSIEGFNMIAAMQEAPEQFLKFGGHPMACGFTLKNPDALEEFKQVMIGLFQKKTAGMDLEPTLPIDAEMTLEEVTWELYDILNQFEPFGQANPKPKYFARGVTIKELKPVGKDGKHLIINVSHTTPRIRKTIGWGLCDETRGDCKNWSKEVSVGDKIDIVFEIGVNEWNGNRELQLMIVDLKKS